MTRKQKMEAFWRVLRNKFVLTAILFFTWLILFDQNSIVDRISLARLNRNLREQKRHYEEQIKDDRQRMEELQGSDEKLEKFAREQYLMKKHDEELFIVIEE